MSGEKKETKPVTGRTAWDFAAEVTQRLGFPIVILILIAYGFYKYQESTKDMQLQLNAAHEELRETAVSIGDINKKMIENIKSGLTELDSVQSRINLAKEQADAEAKKAAAAIALQKEADETRIKAVNDLEKAKQAQKDLQKLRIAKSGAFKDDVKSLLKLLSDIDNDEIMDLVGQIKQNHLVNPSELFEAVAKDPNLTNLQRLSELEGLKLDTLIQFLKENKADFASWRLLRDKETSKVDIALGVVTTSKDEVKGLIYLEIDKGRVLSVNTASRFVFVDFPSLNNWDSNLIIGIFEDTDGEPDYDKLYDMALTSPGWQRLFSDFFGADHNTEILAGKESEVISITLKDFQGRYPAIYNNLVAEEDEVRTAAMMINKAETFNATNIVPITLDRGHVDLGNLRATVIQTLDAAVSRDDKKRQELAGKNFSKSNWGLLAATALRERFAARDLEVSVNRLEVSVVCSFQEYKTEEILKTKMNFTREKAFTESKWHIIGFLEPVPMESPRQMF